MSKNNLIQETMRRLKECKCKVTSCPFCELKGIIANMEYRNGRYICYTCKSEIII